MPKRKIEVSFLAKLGKPRSIGGNLLIYVPKAVTEIYGLKHGDRCQVTVKVLKRAEEKTQ